MTSDVNEWTRAQFEALPFRESWDKEVCCTAIIILPSRKMHDSGYRCMDFVACTKDGPVCRLSGCSDVIHIGGIGGYGYQWLERYNKCPDLIPPVGWSIDCLPKSGLLRMFASGHELIADCALSSFELYAEKKKK